MHHRGGSWSSRRTAHRLSTGQGCCNTRDHRIARILTRDWVRTERACDSHHAPGRSHRGLRPCGPVLSAVGGSSFPLRPRIARSLYLEAVGRGRCSRLRSGSLNWESETAGRPSYQRAGQQHRPLRPPMQRLAACRQPDELGCLSEGHADDKRTSPHVNNALSRHHMHCSCVVRILYA